MAKIDPNLVGMASLVNSTYLGGRFDEIGSGIVVDTAGNPYITGESWGAFPGEINALNDEDLPFAFVAQLDFDMVGFPQLVFSMYLGGSQEDRGHSIAGDIRGDLYVTGEPIPTISTWCLFRTLSNPAG